MRERVPYIEKMAIGVFETCEISLSSLTYSQDCTMTLSETVLISQPASESGAVHVQILLHLRHSGQISKSRLGRLVDTSCTENARHK